MSYQDTNLQNLTINHLSKKKYNELLASNQIYDDELYVINEPNIDAENQPIINVGNPINQSDAATKEYVDIRFGGELQSDTPFTLEHNYSGRNTNHQNNNYGILVSLSSLDNISGITEVPNEFKLSTFSLSSNGNSSHNAPNVYITIFEVHETRSQLESTTPVTALSNYSIIGVSDSPVSMNAADVWYTVTFNNSKIILNYSKTYLFAFTTANNLTAYDSSKVCQVRAKLIDAQAECCKTLENANGLGYQNDNWVPIFKLTCATYNKIVLTADISSQNISATNVLANSISSNNAAIATINSNIISVNNLTANSISSNNLIGGSYQIINNNNGLTFNAKNDGANIIIDTHPGDPNKFDVNVYGKIFLKENGRVEYENDLDLSVNNNTLATTKYVINKTNEQIENKFDELEKEFDNDKLVATNIVDSTINQVIYDSYYKKYFAAGHFGDANAKRGVYASNDGIYWKLIANSEDVKSNGLWTIATNNNGTLVAGLYNLRGIWYSLDSKTWQLATFPTGVEKPNIEKIIYNGEYFIASDYDSSLTSTNNAKPCLYRSDDGITWNAIETAPQFRTYSISYCNGKYLAPTLSGLYVADDPMGEWTCVEDTLNFYTVTYGLDCYIAAGCNGHAGIYRSTDLITWEKSSNYELRDVVFTGKKFYGIIETRASVTKTYAILHSVDGISWQEDYDTTVGWGRSVSYIESENVVFFGGSDCAESLLVYNIIDKKTKKVLDGIPKTTITINDYCSRPEFLNRKTIICTDGSFTTT